MWIYQSYELDGPSSNWKCMAFHYQNAVRTVQRTCALCESTTRAVLPDFYFKNPYFFNFFQDYIRIFFQCTDFFLCLILSLYFQCSCCYKEMKNVQLHFKIEFLIFISSIEKQIR